MAHFNGDRNFSDNYSYGQIRHSRRKDPIRIVFVDFSGAIRNPEMMIDPDLPYHEFISQLTEMTATVAYLLPNLIRPKFPGQGLTLGDGPWLYRLVRPFEFEVPRSTFLRDPSQERHGGRQYDRNQRSTGGHYVYHNVRRTGTDVEDWSLLDSTTAYQRMIDRMSYGYRLQNAWIEVQHHMQKERDERMWAMANMDRHFWYRPIPATEADFQGNNQMNFSMTSDVNAMQYMPLPANQQFMWSKTPQILEPEQPVIQGPLIVDGGRPAPRRQENMHTINPGTDSVLPIVEDIITQHPFTWQPPRPGVLPAPGIDPVEQSVIPPTTTSLPTTIDPSLLCIDNTEAVPRVSMPTASTSKVVDGKLIDGDGKEIVFGLWSESNSLDATISLSDDDIGEAIEVKAASETAGDISPSKTDGKATQTAIEIVEKDPSYDNEQHANKKLRGDGRGRGYWRGRGRGRGRARGRGRGKPS